VPTSAYPTKAARPPYSVLDLSKFTRTTGSTPRPWEDALKQYVRSDLGLGA
jgi:dTDP-4-dehydrorhamnose reductase